MNSRPWCRALPFFVTLLGLTAGMAEAQNQPLSGQNLFFGELEPQSAAIPEVLSTTRLRQSKSKVPGTTSIITGDLIRKLGLMNLVEVFRLVPGMVVGVSGSSNPVTSYHGTSQYEQRRLQVQVDGRTAYRSNLADVDWIAMPVALENIERIEVSRGPNSAAYGINAFLGSINIITRSPNDTAGVETYAAGGSGGHLRAFTSIGDAGPSGGWRLSYEKRKSNGFDKQFEKRQREPYHDGHDINNVNLDSLINIDLRHALSLRAGVLNGVNEEDLYKTNILGASSNPDVKVNNYYLQARFKGATSAEHFYYVQAGYQSQDREQRWSICNDDPINLEACADLPTTPPNPFRADLNQDIRESRLELEIQDTLLFSPNLRLVSGAGYRRDSYRSETFFNGTGHDYQTRIFGNLEYSPFQWLTLNAGGNWEKTTTTGDDYFSPRIASNFIINENHALRFVLSKAVRTPDAFEQNPDWSYRFRNVPPPYDALEGQRLRSADQIEAENPGTSTLGKNLEEERITSQEISYFGQFNLDSSVMKLEVRYFNDDLRNMISGDISFDNWPIDNNVALDQRGVEVEFSLQFAGTLLRATTAHLDQTGRYTGDPTVSSELQQRAVDLLGRLSARRSGSLVWIQDLPLDLTSSVAFYRADEIRGTQLKRADFRLAHQAFGPSYSYLVALTIQHYIDNQPWISPDNIIEDANQFFIEAGVRF